MEFNIIELTEAEISALTDIQLQLLRNAQKEKNKMEHKLSQNIAMYKRLFYSDGMNNSVLLKLKQEELQEEFDYELEIITEQLIYAMELNSPIPQGQDSEDAGYIVDYTLSYTDRYVIVRDYYLAIEDPAERMALYEADDIARRYLSNYYSTLYNVLYVYST